MTLRKFFSTTLGVLSFVVTTADADDERPEAVSPGDPTRLARIAQPCPTFSWTEVERSEAYELAVFDVGDLDGDSVEVLRQNVPAGANSWTPGLDRCLEPGKHYGWSVRALEKEYLSPWSTPRLFKVVRRPAETDLEEAVTVLRESLAGEARPTRAGARLRSTDREGLPAGSAGVGSATVSTGIESPELLVDGAIVAGSFGGDGSGLTGLDWANLVNVPSGFADGTDDSIAYAAGNQLNLNATTFEVVEGRGSDLDADLLDGLHAAAFALEAETYTMTEVDALLTIDNISAPPPGAPTHLRVGPEHRFPGMRRLSWNLDSLIGVGSFVVYQANHPITDANKASAHRKVTSSLYTEVDLFPGSGLQHFRVEAQNVLGEAGPLSPELAIDTASRVAYLADQETDDVYELFVVSASGGVTTKVSGPLVVGGNLWSWAWSPDGSHLAYMADQETDTVLELFVAPATGGGTIKVNDRLVAGGGLYGYAWSPEGSHLAYRADQEIDGVVELFVVPASGGRAVRVNDPLIVDRDVSEFAWSPDGSHLAYMADQETDDVVELFVASASGGGATKVSDPLIVDGNVSDFAWSPDGSRLAYTADQDTSVIVELYVVPASGGGATKVSDPLDTGSKVWDFAWSPDGSRLAYRADETDNILELFVVPASGGGATKVNSPLVSGGHVSSFAWSPNGAHLAYRGDQETAGVKELYVAPASGGGVTRLNDPLVVDGDVWSVAWSPDGSHLAYRGDQDTNDVIELYVVPASGGGATKVSDPPVTTGRVKSFAWSPDGSRLVYRAEQNNERTELFVVPAIGGGASKISGRIPIGGDVISGGWSLLGVE